MTVTVSRNDPFIDVTRGPYNARGDGEHDDTSAILAAWTDATETLWSSPAFTGVTGALFFPPGDYVYTGAGLALGGSAYGFKVVGSGTQTTRISLGASSYLFAIPEGIQHGHVEGMQTVGGKGLFRHALTTANVHGPLTFRDLELLEYTECGIGTMSPDYPYWTVENVQFRGDPDTAIGLAHAGDASGSVATRCRFDANKVHAKLGKGGLGWRLDGCDFIRGLRPASGGVTDLWYVPGATLGGAGQYHVVTACKFGSENLNAADYRVLFADEAAGTDFLTKLPSASASTGYITEHQFVHNDLQWGSGLSAIPLVRSTTDRITSCRYGDCQIGGEFATALSLLDGTSSEADRTVESNTWGPFWNLAMGRETGLLGEPVPNGYGAFLDPTEQWQARGTATRPGAGTDAGYVNVLTTEVAAFTGASAAITTGQADAVGTATAIDVDYADGGGFVYAGFTPHGTGLPHWIEADLKRAPAAALTRICIGVWGGPNPRYWQRVIDLTTTWRTVRFPWIPRVGAGLNVIIFPLSADYAAGVTDRVQVGRVRVYHAREPVNTGPIHLGTGTARIYTGTGSPQSVVTATVGSVFLRTDGGASTTMYLKETGAGNTGWRAV